MSKLLESFELGNSVLKNRAVMAPMTRCRATTDHIPTDIMVHYYSQRATAGLIITEGVAPSPNGTGYARIPGLYNQAQVDAWRPVTAAVHKKGGKIFAQLMHTGRVSHPLNMPEGSEILAPSAIAVSNEQMFTDQDGMKPMPLPTEMSAAQIEEAIEEFAVAARNAVAAGFDGVEIHGANGYLVEQFISPNTNQRTDDYGGSVRNRSRFAVDVTRRVIEEIGESKVGIRLSPYGVFNDVGTYDSIDATYEHLAEGLGRLGTLYIHIVDHSAMGAPEVPIRIKKVIREIFPGKIILAGGYDQARAERDLNSGLGDLVAFARPFIANPDLVIRMAKGIELSAPNPELFYTPGSHGYSDYPVLS